MPSRSIFKPVRAPAGSQGREFRDVQISPDFTPPIRDNRHVSGRNFFFGRAATFWQGCQESAISQCHQLVRRFLDGRASLEMQVWTPLSNV